MKNFNYSCSEYQSLSRRGFLRSSAAATSALAIAPAWLPRIALAQDHDGSRDVLVSIYLRGGIDGMNMCVPYADDNYYLLRPTVNVPPPSSPLPRKAIDLDGFFGFAPAMAPLMEAYQSQKLAIVHACGVDGWTRSHFDAQRFMENGVPFDPYTNTGWLGRHIATTPPRTPGSTLRGVAMTYGMVQTMNGAPNSVAVPDPNYYGLAGDWPFEAEMRASMATMYVSEQDPVRRAAIDTQATIDLLATIDFPNYVPSGGAVYPDSNFGRALKSAAALIKANVGVEAVHLDKDGWDTHSDQGTLAGEMNALMDDLALGLAAFHKDMFAGGRSDFTLIALSEFGRTAAENNSSGTDHGTATAVIVMGGAVIGGRVVRQWPGLAPGQLYEGVDLAPTIDYRNVVAEALAKRAQNTTLGQVFPGHTPQFLGLFN
jgi:uncharacterized protein (DUF1501 family)